MEILIPEKTAVCIESKPSTYISGSLAKVTSAGTTRLATRLSRTPRIMCWKHKCMDGSVQERRNSSALALELPLSCTNPSTWWACNKLPCHGIQCAELGSIVWKKKSWGTAERSSSHVRLLGTTVPLWHYDTWKSSVNKCCQASP